MAYEYGDPSRESDPHALPDVEVFFGYEHQCLECSFDYPLSPDYYGLIYVKGSCPICGGSGKVKDTHRKYWHAAGFLGCLWDSDPIGPFETYAEALADAREGVE
jgi:hypothetical protein